MILCGVGSIIVSTLSTSRMMNSILSLPVDPDTTEVKGCLKGNMIIRDDGNAIDLVVTRR